MTLIVSLLSKRVIAHASDTRHTYIDTKTGKSIKFEDKKVKSIVILGDAGCFLVSYCGRGEIDNLRTDIWLTNTMTDFKAGKRKIGETINHLRDELEKKSDTTKEHHKITVLVSGIEVLGEKGGVSQYILSNFEKNVKGKLIQGDIGKFELHYLTTKMPPNSNPTAAMVLGAEPATENRLFNSRMKKTIKLLKSWKPSKNQDIKLALAQLIKIAAQDKSFGMYISESCIITILPIDSWEPEATYFADPTHKENIAPHLIGSNISFREVSYSGGDDLTLHTY